MFRLQLFSLDFRYTAYLIKFNNPWPNGNDNEHALRHHDL